MKKHFRIIFYLLYSIVVYTFVLLFDLVPDHRVGYSDYDIWLNVVLFPIVLILHGIVSYFIIKPKRYNFFVILTLNMLLSIIEVIIDTWTHIEVIIDTWNHSVAFNILFSRCVYYLVLISIGVLICVIVKFFIRSIKFLVDYNKTKR